MKYIKLVQFLFLLSLVGQSFAQTSQIDSLKAVLESSKEDTSKVNTLIEICVSEYRSSPADAIAYGNEALALADKLDYKKGLAQAFKYIGMGHYFLGDYWETINLWQQSLSYFEAINDIEGISNILNNLGAVYWAQGNDTRALEYYLMSLKAAEQTTDTIRILNARFNIGTLYLKEDSTHNQAKEYYLAALPLVESLGDHDAEGNAYVNLGEIYYVKGELDSALYYYERSLDAYKLSNSGNIPVAMTSIGKVYMQREEYTRAIEIQNEAYEIAEMSDAKLKMTTSLLGLAETYVLQGDITSSISTNRKAEIIAEGIGARNELRAVYEGLAGSYAELSDYNNAFKYQTLLTDIKDSLYITDKDRKLQSMQFNHELETREGQIELLTTDKLLQIAIIQKQKFVKNTFLVGLIVVPFGLIILFFAIRFYRQNKYVKKINVQINDQKDEIETQRDEIEAQRDEVESQRDVVIKQKNEIIESINYAKRIQSAMFPPESYFTELLNENFIFYKPRDIVSGDFYWIKQINQYIVLVAADCTGHGIPGALMSMLGLSYLNEIVQRREITQSNQILNELRKQIKFSLRQHGQPDEAKDGIDLALCVLDLRNMKMQYSGANNPLYLISDVDDVPELKEIKADRMPIGYYQGKDKTFTNHDIQLEMGDTIYIFSDGFIDQKGGKDNKKFMSKKFKNLLLEIHDQPMYDQKDILDKALSDWMGTNSKMDDILVVGVRV